MTLLVDVARVAIVVNLLLLATLTFVWARNYRRLGSKHSLGLALFGAFLLLENVLALYSYLFHPVLHVWVTEIPTIAQMAMTGLRVLEAFGIAFLAWVSLD